MWLRAGVCGDPSFGVGFLACPRRRGLEVHLGAQLALQWSACSAPCQLSRKEAGRSPQWGRPFSLPSRACGLQACLPVWGWLDPGAPSKQSAESRALMSHQLFPCSWHPRQKGGRKTMKRGLKTLGKVPCRACLISGFLRPQGIHQLSSCQQNLGNM